MKIFLSTILIVACGATSTPVAHTSTPRDSSPPPLERLRFNQLALRLNIPLYWVGDHDGDQQVDPNEVAALAFYPVAKNWVEGGEFTPEYEQAHAAILAAAQKEPRSERERWVFTEFENTAPTLLHTDLSALPEVHRRFVNHILNAGIFIDQLYARQVGMSRLAPHVADDLASQSLFRRNWGPQCRTSIAENEASCSAIEGAPTQLVDVYPEELQGDPHFCVVLEARNDADALLTPFTVVQKQGEQLVAVPYTEAYHELMQAITAELKLAADVIEQDPAERALVAYLRAAGTAFSTNEWELADEAWSRMNARNSRWYLRIGPDEVYWDPCSHKAGFHMTFALIDQGSLVWQEHLNPLQTQMEASLAALTPDVYSARDVAFHMPDFIQIVANFGDDRDPLGATIGQSLPNWGVVADEGRGRTVAMTNLYADADSATRSHMTASSLFDSETMAIYSRENEAGLIATILHEATHNLGPASEYRVRNQTDEEIFGGGMASMLEELKAQTGALFFLPLLEEQHVIDERKKREAYLDSIAWAFGHISRGMYTPSGWRKAYSQLAAVQVGFFMDRGAIRFEANGEAANGEDRGAFSIDFERLPAAITELMTEVVRIKASGDREAAEALAATYVDGDTVPMALIKERYLRQPRAGFVYSIDF